MGIWKSGFHRGFDGPAMGKKLYLQQKYILDCSSMRKDPFVEWQSKEKKREENEMSINKKEH